MLILLSACGSKGVNYGKPFQMGERVSVGAVTYVILNSEWKTSLGEGLETRTPTNRFLLLHVTITNGSSGDLHIPLLQLLDARGQEYGELQEGKGIPSWLGLLRKIGGAQTEDGYIAFDAPMGPVKLKVTDAGDLENEKVALIDVPVRLEADAKGLPDAPLTATPIGPTANPVQQTPVGRK